VKCERKLIAEKKGYNFSGYAGTVKRAVKRFACAEPLLTKNFKQSCAVVLSTGIKPSAGKPTSLGFAGISSGHWRLP
jgi:hypothetical protein